MAEPRGSGSVRVILDILEITTIQCTYQTPALWEDVRRLECQVDGFRMLQKSMVDEITRLTQELQRAYRRIDAGQQATRESRDLQRLRLALDLASPRGCTRPRSNHGSPRRGSGSSCGDTLEDPTSRVDWEFPHRSPPPIPALSLPVNRGSRTTPGVVSGSWNWTRRSSDCSSTTTTTATTADLSTPVDRPPSMPLGGAWGLVAPQVPSSGPSVPAVPTAPDTCPACTLTLTKRRRFFHRPPQLCTACDQTFCSRCAGPRAPYTRVLCVTCHYLIARQVASLFAEIDEVEWLHRCELGARWEVEGEEVVERCLLSTTLAYHNGPASGTKPTPPTVVVHPPAAPLPGDLGGDPPPVRGYSSPAILMTRAPAAVNLWDDELLDYMCDGGEDRESSPPPGSEEDGSTDGCLAPDSMMMLMRQSASSPASELTTKTYSLRRATMPSRPEGLVFIHGVTVDVGDCGAVDPTNEQRILPHGSTAGDEDQRPNCLGFLGKGDCHAAADTARLTEVRQLLVALEAERGGEGATTGDGTLSSSHRGLLQAALEGFPAESRQSLWRFCADPTGTRSMFPGVKYNRLVSSVRTAEVERAIRMDVVRTLTDHECFQPDAAILSRTPEEELMRTPRQFWRCAAEGGLHRMLSAYAALRPAIGYCQGMNFLAATVWIHFQEDEEEAFWVFVSLMERYHFASLFDVQFLGLRALLESLRVCLPSDVVEHLDRHQVNEAFYAANWFLTLFAASFECWRAVLTIWDLTFLMEPRDLVLIRVATAVIRHVGNTITQCDDPMRVMMYMQRTIPQAVLHIDVLRAALSVDALMEPLPELPFLEFLDNTTCA